MAPIWINEDGLRAETRPCPRPGCGREVLVYRYRYETLRQIGWPPFRVASFTSWCGHGPELSPMPGDRGVGFTRAGDRHGEVTPGLMMDA